MILLDHPGLLPEESISRLAGLLRRGRPIVYVAAEPVDATNLQRLGETAGSGPRMPVDLVPPPPGATCSSRRSTSGIRHSPYSATSLTC